MTAEGQKIGHELADMAEWLRPKKSLSGQARHNENWESRYEEMRREKEQHLAAQRAFDEWLKERNAKRDRPAVADAALAMTTPVSPAASNSEAK